MKILINKQILKSLNPCTDRYKNYLEHYSDFEGAIEDFLDLEHISYADKIWVSVRVMPRFLTEVFAIDCAVSAATYAAATYAATYAAATYAAAYADYSFYAATYAAATYAATYAAYAAATYAAAYADYSFYAAAYAYADYSFYADVAAYAYADYSFYAAADAAVAYAGNQERQRQIESIIYLVQNHEEDL